MPFPGLGASRGLNCVTHKNILKSYPPEPLHVTLFWNKVFVDMIKLRWGYMGLCLVAQSCLTLWSPMDCSLTGSSSHGIFQARILELVAISYSRGSSRPRDWTHVSCLLHWHADSLPLAPPRKPNPYWIRVGTEPSDGIIIRRWRLGDRHTQGKDHVIMAAEMGLMQLQLRKDFQETPETRQKQGRILS